MRGYDVTALPSLSESDRIPWLTWVDGARELRDNGWITPTNPDDMRAKIKEKVANWADGDRGIVEVQWNDGASHAFNVEKIGDTIVGREAQNPDIKRNVLLDYPDDVDFTSPVYVFKVSPPDLPDSAFGEKIKEAVMSE